MDEKTLKELEAVVIHANEGNWFPFAIVCACLGVIGILAFTIFKMKEKANDKRHSDSEAVVSELAKGNLAMNLIIIELRSDVKHLKANKTG